MKNNNETTAFLTLDLQAGIFAFAPNALEIIPQAANAVEFARSSGAHLIHVGLGFAPGHPEISDLQNAFQRVKTNNLFVKGSESAQFHEAVYRPGDLVVYKHRVGGFTENELHLILRARKIEHLVLMGIATSGIVLSTLRRAYDLDYRCTVLKDACYDNDAEVHRVLTEKVFPMQADVVTVDEYIRAQGN